MGEVCASVVEESQYLSFHGVRVHFRVATPDGVPRERFLLLCSPVIATFHWRKLLPELRQLGALVVVADLPGFGKCDCGPAVPQDSLTRANILWGVLDQVDRQTGAPGALWHLVGHGTACPTILEMAALYPDSVKSQVHISPLLRSPDLFGSAPPERWYQETVFVKENFRRFAEHLSGYPMDDYILDRMREPLLRPGAFESFLRMLRANRRPPAARLGFCPGMVLLGSRDALLTPAVRRDVAQYFSGAEIHELKSAGHFPMETHSKALRDYFRGWIRYIQ